MSTNGDDLDKVLERIRNRVEERRESGDYPPGLEQQLDRHYHHILKGLNSDIEATTALKMAIGNLQTHADFSLDHIDTGSKNPLKRFAHRLVGRLTIRQTHGVISQLRLYGDALDEVLECLLHVVGSAAGEAAHGAGGRDRDDHERRLHTVLDRIDLLDSRLNRLEDQDE